jgi:hypothetical protein
VLCLGTSSIRCVQCLETSIKPDLERLRQEKEEFMLWQAACSNEEKLGHVVAAHRYWKVLQAFAASQEHVESLKAKVASKEELVVEMKVPSPRYGFWCFAKLGLWHALCTAYCVRACKTEHLTDERQHGLQDDIKDMESQIAQLKAQQDDSTSKQLADLQKAADKGGLKLAQQQGLLETHQEDVQVRLPDPAVCLDSEIFSLLRCLSVGILGLARSKACR